MTLSSRLSEYFQAAFSGVFIQTFEPDDALAEIGAMCRERSWTLAAWDLERGMRLVHSPPGESVACPPANDPLSAVRALPALASPEGTAVLVLRGFHRFWGSAEIVQALERQLTEGKVRRTFLVLLGPAMTLPAELERSFVVIDHALPSREQLHEIARGVATADELPQDVDLERVLDAAAGLTRQEAEGAFALSLVRQGRVSTETLWELKAQSLLKGGALGLYRGGETFDSLGGLNALKAFCRRSLDARVERRSNLARPRGVLLLGVPGTGKSAFAKALGAETGRPTLTLDVGALMGSLVGQDRAEFAASAQDRGRDGAGDSVHRRSRKGARRRHGRRWRFGGRIATFRRTSVLAQRSRIGRICRRDVQQHRAVASGVLTCTAVRRHPFSRPAGRRGTASHLADVSREVRTGREATAAAGRRLDWRRGSRVLSLGEATRRATEGSRAEHRAGLGDRCRVGRTLEDLGDRPLLVRRARRTLSAILPRQRSASPSARRTVVELKRAKVSIPVCIL